MSEVKPSRLKSLDTPKRSTLADPKKYTSLIKKLRIALPVLALGILTLVFSWNSFEDSNIEPIKPKASNPRDQNISKNELINPRFESVDQKNQPYVITAAKAVQSTQQGDIIDLHDPFGDILLNDGRWLAAKAQKATFNQKSQQLFMQNNVELFYDLGYTLRTKSLDIDVQQGKAYTSQAVEISGPAEYLSSTAMTLDNQSQTLVFSGPAKLILYQTQGGFNLGDITP